MATAERLWSILTDLTAYPNWNPFIRAIKGSTPNAELRWVEHFLIPGIFDGEHYFKIAQMDTQRLRFTQGERFSGLLVGMAKASLDRGTNAGFIAMNAALKFGI